MSFLPVLTEEERKFVDDISNGVYGPQIFELLDKNVPNSAWLLEHFLHFFDGSNPVNSEHCQKLCKHLENNTLIQTLKIYVTIPGKSEFERFDNTEPYHCKHYGRTMGALNVSPDTLQYVAALLLKNPHIEGLDLSSDEWEADSFDHICRMIENSKTLEKFVSEWTAPIEQKLFHRLCQALSSNTSITELYLGEIGLRDMTSLSQFLSSNHSLKTLVLKRNPIGDMGITLLGQGQRTNDSLCFLDVKSCEISQEGAINFFGELSQNPKSKLSQLNLVKNKIGDEGAKYIAEVLKLNKSLEILKLSHNEIDTEGLFNLSTSLLENETLTELHLGANSFDQKIAASDKGFSALFHLLKNNKSIRKISFTIDNLDEKFLEEMKKCLKLNHSLLEVKLKPYDPTQHWDDFDFSEENVRQREVFIEPDKLGPELRRNESFFETEKWNKHAFVGHENIGFDSNSDVVIQFALED